MVVGLKSKYGNIPTIIDGIRFPSKLEARYYTQLLLFQKSGHVKYFLRQVPIHLPGGIRYLVDFQVFYENGDVEYVDCKGRPTPMYIMKKKQVEALYPIKIIEIKR